MSGTVPHVPVEELARWLRTHQGRYTNEALRGQLLQYGYSPGEIDRAFELAETAEPLTDARAWSAGQVSWAASEPPAHGLASQPGQGKAFFAGLAAMVGLPWFVSFVDPAASGIVLLLAFVGVIVAAVVARNRGEAGVAKGLAYSLVALVLVPVILVVGLFGICLVAGAPKPV